MPLDCPLITFLLRCKTQSSGEFKPISVSFNLHTWRSFYSSNRQTEKVTHIKSFDFCLIRLGCLKLNWKDIPDEVRGKIENEVVKNSGQFLPIDLTTLLRAFDRLYYDWQSRPEIREVVLNSFVAAFSNTEESGCKMERLFAWCIYHLGKAGIQWNEIPSKLQEMIFRQALKYSKTFTAFYLKTFIKRYVKSAIF
jgi:hypothetical protein